jgi:putative membrane protein
MGLVVGFALLHMLAARWIYSYVPYDAWFQSLFGWSPTAAFGWTRNHFDRLVHFAYGLLLFRPFRLSWGRLARSERAGGLIAWEFILATSALYELFEWGLTLLLSPGDAENYNGQQGDLFDAQKDMALAALGGLVAWALTSLWPRRHPFASLKTLVLTTGSVLVASLFYSCSTDSGTLGDSGVSTKDPVVAAKSWAALDSVCVETINTHRRSIAMAPLASWTDSAPCFARQAGLDDASGTAHKNFGLCKEWAQNTCPGWSADTTFAARVTSMKSCIQSMWDEGPGEPYSEHGHYLNMTNSSYTKVGCGFHQKNGSLWINMNFR